jgi:muramoyltetrapeptide carboxypeptidase
MSKLRKLEYLKPGDIVDVVAPGFPVLPEVMIKVRDFLIKEGFVPRIPENIIEPHPLFANTDEKRAKMLIDAVKAKDSKAIWFLRGGYGSNHLLPALRKLKKQKPKITIGISDITSLHGHFIQKWGWTGLHGSLLDRIGKGLLPNDVLAELLEVIRGQKSELVFLNLTPLNKPAKKRKKIKASVLGGNLVVVAGHLGTDTEFNFKNKIVFFEETGERGYRVDRLLLQLSEAGCFKNCKAVVFGDFIGGDEPKADPQSQVINKVEWVLQNWSANQKFPVLRGLPCGHDTVQRVLPLNTEAALELKGETAQLVVQTGVQKCD